MMPERVAILWGGGLGDLLVMRPVLEAVCRPGWPAPLYLTRSIAETDPLKAMGLPVERLLLPPGPREALALVRGAGHFDRVYSGPHNRWRTRMLARTVDAERHGPVHPRGDCRFLADVIAADVVAMGWMEHPPPVYGSRPLFPLPLPEGPVGAELPRGPYLVIHPGSKSRWETTRWPMDRWSLLLRQLAHAGWHLWLVGGRDEHEVLQQLAASVSAAPQVAVHTDWPLWQLERAVASARGVLCHNSGIMHLALAYERPTIVLTGSSAPYWQASYAWVRNLTSGECQLACNRYRCPVPGFHAKCIRHLEIGRVLAAAHELWGPSPG